MRLRTVAAAGYVSLALLSAGLLGAAAIPPTPLAPAAARFSGKFELVPLFKAAHRPVISNGHQAYAERNTIAFRTDAGDVVTAFAGSSTDLASIPQAIWPILPPDGPYAEAAAIHDPCYRTAGTFDWKGPTGVVHHGRTRAAPYVRAECDEILREAMAALAVPSWKRVVIYEAVRLGGGSGWGR